MDDFRFGCTACGKCCTASPEITVVEALRLYGDFVVMLKLGGAADPDTVPVQTQAQMRGRGVPLSAFREQFDHLASMGAVVIRTRGVRIAMRLSVATVSSGALWRCPMLADDNRCSIFDRRPLLCRAMPLDYWAPETRQHLRFADVQARVARGEFDCDTGPAADLLWDGAALAPGPYRDAYLEGVARSKEDWPVLSVLRREMEAGNPGLPSLEQVGGAILAGEGYAMDFLGVLMTLHAFRDANRDGCPAALSDLPEVPDFLDTQLELIRRQVADQMRRKAGVDKPVTARLRALEKHYAAAVRDRVWE